LSGDLRLVVLDQAAAQAVAVWLMSGLAVAASMASIEKAGRLRLQHKERALVRLEVEIEAHLVVVRADALRAFDEKRARGGRYLQR